jgi:hypothetical protein
MATLEADQAGAARLETNHELDIDGAASRTA